MKLSTILKNSTKAQNWDKIETFVQSKEEALFAARATVDRLDQRGYVGNVLAIKPRHIVDTHESDCTAFCPRCNSLRTNRLFVRVWESPIYGGMMLGQSPPYSWCDNC